MAQLMGLMGAGGGLFAGGAATGGGFGAAATMLSPILSIAGGLMQASQYKAQAAEHEREAIEARVAGHYQAAQLERKQRQRRARDKAAQIESGVYSGTGLDLEAQQVDYDIVDAALQVYAGEQRGKAADFQAKQAQMAASSSIFGAFMDGISGFANMDPLNLAPGGGAVRRGGIGPIAQYGYARPRYGLV